MFKLKVNLGFSLHAIKIIIDITLHCNMLYTDFQRATSPIPRGAMRGHCNMKMNTYMK